MQKFSSIIVGKINVSGKEYEAELINDFLAIKTECFNKELNSIINETIEFLPIAKGDPTFYLYIDKKSDDYYSYSSFHILLLYRHFADSREIGFEIISKGFTNAVNIPTRELKDPFSNIKKKLEVDFLKTSVCICGKEYEASFINHGILKSNNLCPADFSTGLKLVPKDGTFLENIFNIFSFAIKFIQFITLNTYAKIDNFVIYNDVGGYSEIEINDDFDDIDIANDRFLYLGCLGKDINKVINVFPDAMTRQHNLYHYKKGWVFEFDIVRLSGTFEGVFRENVEKSDSYKEIIKLKKKAIHYDELNKLLKDFEEKNQIKNNEDYNACLMMFKNYGGTLKNKLEYVLTDFCKTMKMIVIDMTFFYSPMLFETRIKDSRNSICHGLNTKKIDWKNIGNDTLLLQELIYFILLKYKLNLTDTKIKTILDKSFGYLNSELSLFKKDDPRLKWAE